MDTYWNSKVSQSIQLAISHVKSTANLTREMPRYSHSLREKKTDVALPATATHNDSRYFLDNHILPLSPSCRSLNQAPATFDSRSKLPSQVHEWTAV